MTDGLVTGGVDKGGVFLYPEIVRNWRLDYEARIDPAGGNAFLANDLAEEIEDVAMPALRAAVRDGVVTQEEAGRIGADVWNEYHVLLMKIRHPDVPTWRRIFLKVANFLNKKTRGKT